MFCSTIRCISLVGHGILLILILCFVSFVWKELRELFRVGKNRKYFANFGARLMLYLASAPSYALEVAPMPIGPPGEMIEKGKGIVARYVGVWYPDTGMF